MAREADWLAGASLAWVGCVPSWPGWSHGSQLAWLGRYDARLAWLVAWLVWAGSLRFTNGLVRLLRRATGLANLAAWLAYLDW